MATANFLTSLTWSKFKQQQANSLELHQQFNITDKSLFAEVKQSADSNNKFFMLRSGTYFFAEGIEVNSLNYYANDGKLMPGIYIIRKDSNSPVLIYYYHSGKTVTQVYGGNNDNNNSSSNIGTVTSVNGVSPDLYGAIVLTAENIWADGSLTNSVAMTLNSLQQEINRVENLIVENNNDTNIFTDSDLKYGDTRYEDLAHSGNLFITGRYEGEVDGGNGW